VGPLSLEQQLHEDAEIRGLKVQKLDFLSAKFQRRP
jgi:hypothetical protein